MRVQALAEGLATNIAATLEAISHGEGTPNDYDNLRHIARLLKDKAKVAFTEKMGCTRLIFCS